MQALAFPGAKTVTLSVRMRRDAAPASLRFEEGEGLREDRKHKEAAEAYSAAIALSRVAFPQARTGRARSYLAMGELEKALDDAKLATATRGPNRAEAQTVLANVLRAQGQYEEAAVTYRKALRWSLKNPAPEAHTGLAITLDELDEPEDALTHFRLALKQDGNAQPILYYLLGNLLMKLERNTQAIHAFEDFLKQAPDSELAPAVRSLLESLRRG